MNVPYSSELCKCGRKVSLSFKFSRLNCFCGRRADPLTEDEEKELLEKRPEYKKYVNSLTRKTPEELEKIEGTIYWKQRGERHSGVFGNVSIE